MFAKIARRKFSATSSVESSPMYKIGAPLSQAIMSSTILSSLMSVQFPNSTAETSLLSVTSASTC